MKLKNSLLYLAIFATELCAVLLFEGGRDVAAFFVGAAAIIPSCAMKDIKSGRTDHE